MKTETKEMTLQERKDRITDYVQNYLDDDKISVIELIIDMSNSWYNKHDMIKFINTDKDNNLSNYDTAFPIDYFRNIRDVYPGIINGCFIYDYSKKSFGELTNINDLFIQTIMKKLR